MSAIPSLRDFSRQAVLGCLAALPRDEVLCLIDATMGNGQDTLFLAESAAAFSQAAVHAFDVQPKALERTAERLAAAGRQACLHLIGHERAVETLNAFYALGQIPALAVVLFNLGFLPAADRRLITHTDTTIAALRTFLPILRPGGLMSVHMYAGHPGGAEEAEAVSALVAELPVQNWSTALYTYPNKRMNPEHLVLIEKKIL